MVRFIIERKIKGLNMTIEEKLAEYVLEQLCERQPHATVSYLYSYSFIDSGNYPNIEYVNVAKKLKHGRFFDHYVLVIGYKIRTRSDRDPYFNGNIHEFTTKNKELLNKFNTYNEIVKINEKNKKLKQREENSQLLSKAIRNTIEGIV